MIRCICGEKIDTRPFSNINAVGEDMLSSITIAGEYRATLCRSCTIELKRFVERKIKSAMTNNK